MTNLPIIRLEIEHLKHYICNRMINLDLQTDEYIEAALKKVCSPEHLQSMIDRYTREAVEETIRLELGAFFKTGEGRANVSKALRTLLKKELGKS